MSAPPIGIINNTPIKKEIIITVQKIFFFLIFLKDKITQKFLILKLSLNNVAL